MPGLRIDTSVHYNETWLCSVPGLVRSCEAADLPKYLQRCETP